MALLLPSMQFWYQEEQFCDVILNLDQWFRRICCLKIFLIWKCGALLFSEVELFVQFWKRVL